MQRTDASKKLVIDGRIYVKSPGLSTRDIMIIPNGKEHLHAKKLNNILHEYVKTQVTVLLHKNDRVHDMIPEESTQRILRKPDYAAISRELWIEGERPQRRHPTKKLLAKEATRVRITVEILDDI